MTALQAPKPFKSYAELVALLCQRGLRIHDLARAERKLMQIGYYRLSGYWYVCREQEGNHRKNQFQPGTNLDAVLQLYLLDKQLRQLMLDAIERIEVQVRSVIAHEVGFHDPLAYQSVSFINPRQTRNYVDRQGRQRNAWLEWSSKQNEQVNRSHEDAIKWHRENHKAMPFWVVVEAWDFGTVSKYYEMLKQSHQNRICQRMGVDNAVVLRAWLQELNILRNRCAHHCRIWNQNTNNPLPVLSHPYFQVLGMATETNNRLYGLIAIIWFLVRRIGPHSQWLSQVAQLIDKKPELPGCTYAAMGLRGEASFPLALFKLADSPQ